MITKKLLSTYLLIISILLINIIDRLASFGRLFSDDTYLTVFLLTFSILLLFSLVNRKFLRTLVDSHTRTLLYLWLTILFFGFIRGLFVADDYYEWKQLLINNLPFALSTFSVFIGCNIFRTKLIVSFFVRYVLLFGFFLIPLGLVSNEQLYARIMVPVCFLIVFIPYIKKKWGILVLTVAIVSCAISLGFRIHLLKVTITLLILLLFYFKLIKTKIVKISFFSFIIFPIVFLILGLNGSFNVFDYIRSSDEYSYKTLSRGEKVNFNADTRTFLYYEVTNSVDNMTELLFGNGMVANYRSEFFDSDDKFGVRNSTEVGALNIFLFYGIIGIITFLLIIFRISFLAIYYSNNSLSKMLGLVIASRAFTIFLEEKTKFDINFFWFWLIIGLLSSVHFRSLSDLSIRNYFAKL